MVIKIIILTLLFILFIIELLFVTILKPEIDRVNKNYKIDIKYFKKKGILNILLGIFGLVLIDYFIELSTLYYIYMLCFILYFIFGVICLIYVRRFK